MNLINIMILAALSTSLIYCGGSAEDPETQDRGEFNPPGNLQTITDSGKITLTWVGANAEDDFKGYHVFGVKGTIADLKSKISFPTDSNDIANNASVPRCKDNSGFFESFGFGATDETCEATSIVSIPDEDELSDFKLSQSGMQMLLADADETIDFNLACTGSGQNVADGTTSRAVDTATGKQLGRVYCDVEKVYDKDATDKRTAIENGSTYTFFVVAVKGSKYNEISWVSNVVEDTAAHTLYSGTLELEAEKYKSFQIDTTSFTSISSFTEGSCSTTGTPCQLSSSNADATNDIWIARDKTGSSGTYAQRLFVSTSSAVGTVQILPRGNQTYTDSGYNSGNTSPKKPGDTAIQADSSDYLSPGTKVAIYQNQVFDIRIERTSGTVLYGKLVIKDLSYAGDKSSKATMSLTVVMQPTAGNVNYFQ